MVPVAQAFQPAGSRDFPVPRFSVASKTGSWSQGASDFGGRRFPCAGASFLCEGHASRMLGSTGDPPVPSGDPPLGTERRVRTFSEGYFHGQSAPRSVGPVARRDGQVARATPSQFGAQATRLFRAATRRSERGDASGLFRKAIFMANQLPVPLGQWPDGTGKLPVPPHPSSKPQQIVKRFFLKALASGQDQCSFSTP